MTPMTADPEAPLTAARRWMITAAVMIVTVTQVLDTTVTNVALPHIQGALSAAVDEVSWVLTSYLAANAVVLPATGWLASVLGRKRLFLICTVMFTMASALCGLAFVSTWAPSLHHPTAGRMTCSDQEAGPGAFDVCGDLPCCQEMQ